MVQTSPRAHLALAAALSLVVACGDSTDPTRTIPASLERTAGHGLAAVVGTPIATDIAVRVSNAHGETLEGVTVTWSVLQGGGSTGAATSITNADGIASTSWTLGTTAGLNQVRASVDGLDPVTFDGNGSAGPPAAIEVQSGADQDGHAGLALANPVVVKVMDQFGNAAPFVNVSWSVTAGAGSVDEELTLANASGLAQVTWTLGTVAGVANSLSATTTGATPATVNATATVGVPALVSLESGDGQTAVVATELPEPLVVRITDQFGNANAGVTVSWFLFGAVEVNETETVTDANGVTAVIATFGTVAGPTSVVAEVGAASGGFVLHSTHAAPTTLVSFTGVELTATVGTALPLPIQAKVTDDYGNPVPGFTVAWSTSAGSGTVEVLEGETNLIGLSSASWTLGPSPGTHTATASALGQSVQFTATATAAGARPQ